MTCVYVTSKKFVIMQPKKNFRVRKKDNTKTQNNMCGDDMRRQKCKEDQKWVWVGQVLKSSELYQKSSRFNEKVKYSMIQ